MKGVVDLRRNVEQGLREVPQAVANFVEQRWPALPHLVRQPQEGNVSPQVGQKPVPLPGQQVLRVQPVQGGADGPQLLQNGASLRLRGMGGENHLDGQPVQQLLHAFRRHALSRQGVDGLGDGVGQGAGTSPLLPRPQHPHPLVFLGQVDQMEVGGEGFQDW